MLSKAVMTSWANAGLYIEPGTNAPLVTVQVYVDFVREDGSTDADVVLDIRWGFKMTAHKFNSVLFDAIREKGDELGYHLEDGDIIILQVLRG